MRARRSVCGNVGSVSSAVCGGHHVTKGYSRLWLAVASPAVCVAGILLFWNYGASKTGEAPADGRNGSVACIEKERVKPERLRPQPEGAREAVKVAAVQFVSEMGRPERNRKRLEVFVRQAAQNGAKIVVLPETSITGYMTCDLRTTWQVVDRTVTNGLRGISPAKVAETVPGPSTRAFGKLAKELGIYLTIPLVEVDRKSGRYFNTVVLVGPDGALLLHYRKLNPWPYAERGWAERGDRGHAYVDTPYGRLALLICYDINFEPPHLRRSQVDILLYLIAWVEGADSTWFRKELPQIARENNMSIIGANWTVPEKPDWHGYGQSLIIARTGQVLARVKHDLEEEIIYADLPVTAAPHRRARGESRESL